MAHSLSAKKRIRQNAQRRARNLWRLRRLRTSIKSFLDLIAHGSTADAEKSLREACKVIDRSAAKGIIHKNQASRRKSRLTKRFKAKAGTLKKA
jgi:small subunit ribosomal protein S20